MQMIWGYVMSEEKKINNAHERKGENMNVAVETGYKRLDKSKLKNRKKTIVSSEDALKDVIPIQWSDEVLNGTKKVSLMVCK